MGQIRTLVFCGRRRSPHLALEHRQIPPSLHYTAPNPAIDFAESPFRVADRLTGWAGDGVPRRAGVNSFGLGGTNLKGYFLGGNLGLGENVWATLRWMSANNIAGTPFAVDVLQVDLNARF